MKTLRLCLLLLCLPLAGFAGDRSQMIRDIVEKDILPGFDRLQAITARLAETANRACDSAGLPAAFAEAFLAWTSVSHLRFGPSEDENRAFALAYWPDTRGMTPKALDALLDAGDAGILAPQNFQDMSIAVRGFHALEYLLYESRLLVSDESGYRCALIRAVAGDIAATSRDLNQAWASFVPVMIDPGPEGPYRDESEVLRALHNAAATGLQFTADLRLGRPLGSFDRPRPKLAEARRSGLSLQLAGAAVQGSAGLAIRLAGDDPVIGAELGHEMAAFNEKLGILDDPAFAGVATPAGRIRVEALQTYVHRLHHIVMDELGPHLGISPGFNALDGD